MSTLPLAHPGAGSSAAAMIPPRSAQRTAVALAGALLVVVLYAAFAHGAASTSTDARVQVALAIIATLAGAAGIWTRTLRFSAPAVGVAGVGLLALFAVWSGMTILWSVAPNQTWIELNRAVTYVIVVCLGIALGASDRRALGWIGTGFVGVALAVTAYALGQKLLPGLRLDGLVNLNQSGPLPRLQEPFGYWNALALFVAMGVPIALALVVDQSRPDRERIGALLGVELMLLVIGLTYSRGAMIALVLGLAVGIGLSSARLRSCMWLGVACIALVGPLVFGLVDHTLTTTNMPLHSRESAGMVLLAILLASVLALVVGGRELIQLERAAHLGPRRARTLGRVLAGAAVTLLLAGLLAITLSARGLPGTISHEWNNFTATRATSVYQPGRLLSVDSENRWVWWKEAAGAFSAKPVEGWGAGSFPVVHLLYRRDVLSVNQPHSVPLQFLAETGLVGALVGIGGFTLLLVAAIRTVRRVPSGRERLMRAALLAGALVYGLHALYDWDWNIPGVTFPALVFLGVSVGSASGGRQYALTRLGSFRAAPRALGLAALTLFLCTFALSASLPSWAASKASDAVVAAASSSPANISAADATAQLAGRLDPLSDAGPRVEATINARRGALRAARADLLEALKREPTDAQTWLQLAYVEFSLNDPRDAIKAGSRWLALDPHAQSAMATASSLGHEQSLLITPPSDSATRQPLGEK